MTLLLISTCSVLLYLTYRFRDPIDFSTGILLQRLYHRFKNLLHPAVPVNPQLLLISHIISGVRSGKNLESVLEELKWLSLPRECLELLRDWTNENTRNDSLSVLLRNGMGTGAPVLPALLQLQKNLAAAQRLQLRVQALSSQARAQAEILSLLTPFLILGFCLIDSETFTFAAHNSSFWALLGVSFLFLGIGRIWCRRLLQTALEPHNFSDMIVEKTLPSLVLNLQAYLSLGYDAETAWEKSIQQVPDFRQRSCLVQTRDSAIPDLQHLKQIIQLASRSGAPLREDLQQFQAELHAQIESRWEERAQRIPVKILAPLFCCFFPSTLLGLLALILPAISRSL